MMNIQTKNDIYTLAEKCRELKASKLTFPEACEELGMSKTMVRKHLKEINLTYRDIHVPASLKKEPEKEVPRWVRDEEATINWAALMKEHHPHMLPVQSGPTNVGA